MILRHCRNCGEPLRRVAGEEVARCFACTPHRARSSRSQSPSTPEPVVELDPATRVAVRAIETAQLLASLTPDGGGVHEGEARHLAEMASGDVRVLRQAMTVALADDSPAVSTIAGALLLHAYEVAAGLRLR